MALPVNGSTYLIPALLVIYRPRKDERLSWPSWLTCSGWFTHISGHPSAAGRAQDREVRQSETDVLPLCYATNQSKFIYPKSLGRFDKLETSGAGCCIAGMMINVLAYADDIVLMAPSCARQPSRGKYRAATRAGYHASAALASHTADWCRTTGE